MENFKNWYHASFLSKRILRSRYRDTNASFCFNVYFAQICKLNVCNATQSQAESLQGVSDLLIKASTYPWSIRVRRR